MNKRTQTNKETEFARSATVLVLVVVLVALLAIMGTTFVINSHINLQAVKNQAGGTANEGKVNSEEIEISVDSVISQIQTTLAEDLWGRPQDMTTASAITNGNMMNAQRLLGLPANSTGTTLGTVTTNNNTNYLTNIGGTNYYYCLNEPWDAPVRFANAGQTDFPYYNAGWQTANNVNVDGDPWLASSEPNSTVEPPIWPQITDLFLVKFTDPATNYDNWPSITLFTNVPAKECNILPTDPNYATRHPSANDLEMYADADGDGVLDSIWLYQRSFFNENPNTQAYTAVTYADADRNNNYCGLVTDLPIKSSNPDLTYRMAVRIVDTCGMVNVNTAWMVPSDLPAADNSRKQLNRFLGNVMAGDNIYGCTGSMTSTDYTYDSLFGYISTNTDSTLPGKAKDPTLQDLIYFQKYYLLQFENPDWSGLSALSSKSLASTKELANFYPFDISDEMELRYKWASPGLGYKTGSLDPGSRSILETKFTDLYGDSTASGKYTDDSSTKDGAFTASDSTYAQVMADLQKRTRLTAYSFSRNIRTVPYTYANPAVETVAEFDGRMKNLDRAVWALVYRVKSTGGTNVFPYDPDIDTDVNLNAAQKDAARTKSRDANTKLAQEFVKLIYNSFLKDKTNSNYADGYDVASDSAKYATYHTWQYIANLVDYLDDDEEPTDIDTNNTGLQTALGLGVVDAGVSFANSHVYGLEKHAVISEVVVTCNLHTDVQFEDNTPGKEKAAAPATAQYSVQVELYNPWNDTVSPGSVRYYYLTNETGSPEINEIDTKKTLSDINSRSYAQAAFDGTLTTINLTSTPQTVEGTPNVYSSYKITLFVVTYADANGTIPEDIFRIPLSDLPASTGLVSSYERSSHSPWTTMLSSYNKQPTNTLGSVNTYNATINCCGYATVTTDKSVAKDNAAATRMADVWCDPTIDDLWRDSPTGGGKIAKIRNLGDLLIVPYVGYCRDVNGEYKGIGDWLLSTDNQLRFDLLETGDNDKGHLFREGLLSRYTILNREDDQKDQINADNDNDKITNYDTIDEMRLPGLINVNTASAEVLSALHPLLLSGSAAIGGTKPFKSIADFCSQAGMNALTGTHDDIGILGLSSPPTTDYDILQKEGLFTRIANLITTRSDTFCAYIYVQALDKSGNVMAERREMALFDRSLCNQPPLTWDTVNSKWIPNPKYRPVKVVSRMRVE
jgi:hypothetical protein